MAVDPVVLEIFRNLLQSVAEEMGVALRRTAFSPNIKERADHSCAVFDPLGRTVAQAEHLPVHLGSMPLSVRAALEQLELHEGDVAMVNDPYNGGTHLPDVTLVTPVYERGQHLGFVASRAHHADVGGMSPGSMPLSTELFQEGLIIPPVKLIEGGRLNEGVMRLLLANTRTPQERQGDLRAQLAAGETGRRRLVELARRYGAQELLAYMDHLIAYAERLTRAFIATLPQGTYSFEDALDDDGVDSEPVVIKVAVTINGDRAKVDFTGSSPQRKGSVNAVYAITLSAVYYVFRSLAGPEVPSNSGPLAALEVIAPEGTVVNARRPAAVAAGNVETSQRLVDVILGALHQACPHLIPAASQGTMNNTVIGGYDPGRRRYYTYYETIGGGMGARPGLDGLSAVHTHMTNTLNTPVEALEYAYPFLVRRYAVREGSGGRGQYQGGDGMVREIELLAEAHLNLLTDRRSTAPYGLAGGESGQRGENRLIVGDTVGELPGKVSLEVPQGAVIRVATPGGGGWGEPDAP